MKSPFVLLVALLLSAVTGAEAQGPRLDAPRLDPSPGSSLPAPTTPGSLPAPTLGTPTLGTPTLGTQADPGGLPPSVPSMPSVPELIVDFSQPRVSITSAFQGENVLLFGMFDPPGEIVVVVVGPPARETVMRKERVLGLWLNTGRQAFDDVPAYYAIAASQPLQRLLARGAGGEILSLEDRLASIKPSTPRAPAELTRFRGGLVEVKRQEGLYPAAIGQVTVQAGRLFRAELPFPSRLPEGVYDVRTYLLREGKIVAAVSRPLPVGKVGFSAQLAGWSQHQGPLYGLGAIVMALTAGWLGGMIMRRL